MKFHRAFALGGASLLSLSTSAFAQNAPTDAANVPATAEADNVPDDQVIVIQARRRNELAQDVPLTVNAVSSETIEKLNLRNFQEITSVVPGLSLTPNANGIGSSSSLRGVNQDVNVSGENGTVQFYFNDAPVGSNFVLQAMYDIGQVEVQRGPQGTLRGRSTPSGSITVAPRAPDLSRLGATFIGTAATHGTTNLQFGINVPIIADRLAIRIAGLTDRNRSSHITSLNSAILPSGETDSIRASVRAQPLTWLRAGFVFESLDVRSTSFDQVQSFSNLVPGFTPGVDQTGSAGTVFLSPPLASPRLNNGAISVGDRLSVAGAPRRLSQHFNFYGWNAEADFAGQSLIYVGSHLDSRFHPVTNQDVGVTFPAQTLFQDALTTSKNTSHEIRLQNIDRVAGMFDYVVGYFRQDPSSNSETILSNSSLLRFYVPTAFGLLALPSPGVPIPVPPILAQSTAIFIPLSKLTEESYFGNLVFHVGERTEISGGLRRIRFTNDSQGLFIGCTPVTFAAGTCRQSPGSENDYDLTRTIYNATIRHRFNDNLMVYATTGTSVRPPVRAVGDFSIAPTALELSHITLREETSRSYEVGIKSDWLDHRLIINVTAYHQTFQNYPYRAATGIYFVNINSSGQPERGQFNFVSAVPVRVNGIESEIVFTPTRYFRLSAVTNYSDSRTRNAMLACADVNRDGVADVAVPTLAQLQAAYGAEHIAECPSNGQSATFLPKLSGSVQGEATLPFNGDFSGYVRGLLNWRGRSTIDPNNPYDNVGAYGLFNAFAGLRDPHGGWEVSLFVKNLFNTTRITSAESSPFTTAVTYVNIASQRPVGSASYQSYYSGVTVTPPREFGISARFAFGSH
jgi:iron complex outermembrane receptor protein